MFKDPFDAKSLLGRRCSCGADHEPQDHDKLTANSAQAAVPGGDEARWNRVVDAAVLRAVFPVDATRRQFLTTVGAATAMAMSGLDQALWDIKGKAAGWPLYKLLGGSNRPVPAYAGGISLGYQPPEALVAEAEPMVEMGYRALKLRIGDTVANDIARMTAVRRRFGDGIAILTDANTGYSVADVRRVLPAMDELGIGWLEEPFPAHDHRSYALARSFGRTPLAAGENHYTRFEFNRVLEDGSITILQPDLSKTGGLTEALALTDAARAAGFEVMVGCMLSTSLAMAPASLLAGLAEFVDLDGPLLLAKDRTPALRYEGDTLHPPTPELWGWSTLQSRNSVGIRRPSPG